MSDTTTGLDQVEELVLTNEVSDESLETAAGAGRENTGLYTLGSCTGFISCPPQ